MHSRLSQKDGFLYLYDRAACSIVVIVTDKVKRSLRKPAAFQTQFVIDSANNRQRN